MSLVKMKNTKTGGERMAKKEKMGATLAKIDPAKALAPLMEAFHVSSEKVARSLISEAAQAIYGKNDGLFDSYKKTPISKNEIDEIASLMRGISPQDTLETLYAAHIVVGHILGMRRLSKGYLDDQKLGLSLLRFSGEAMQMLIRKRTGGMQNISVNYNYGGQGNAILQAVLPDKRTIDAD